RCPLRSSPST
ncbi:hypothetical protein AB1N83_010712, partial [Pleurotus pulmonarius]